MSGLFHSTQTDYNSAHDLSPFQIRRLVVRAGVPHRPVRAAAAPRRNAPNRRRSRARPASPAPFAKPASQPRPASLLHIFHDPALPLLRRRDEFPRTADPRPDGESARAGAQLIG